jgi:predicted esterase
VSAPVAGANKPAAGVSNMVPGKVGATGTGGAAQLPMAGSTGIGSGGVGAVPGAGAAGVGGVLPTGPVAGAGGPPAGMAGAGAGKPTMPPPNLMTSTDPMIPDIKGDCPSLETGALTNLGVDSIQIESGPMPETPTAPMLIYWHGTGSTSGEYAFMAAEAAQGVTSQGGVIVSFQGTSNMGDCSPSGTFVFCTGDFDIVDQLVACAVKNRNVDPHRIYSMGCSAGGLMATAMAAQRSSYIAAASPNSGGEAIPQAFQNDHTPALMTVHGMMGSDVVIVDFSQTSATADMAFKMRGAFVIDCDTGGGHCGGGGLAGDAWNFLQNHPFGVNPEPWASGLPAGFSPQCKVQ